MVQYDKITQGVNKSFYRYALSDVLSLVIINNSRLSTQSSLWLIFNNHFICKY